jgi:predicted transcriptional regulator
MSETDNSTHRSRPAGAHRRSVLDLAPLELDCMNTLWPLGEATVREIREGLVEKRPRAYTTIMTIMDRLARKGIVERVQRGRAYVYRPQLTLEQARAQAVKQLIDGFFGGSQLALAAQLQASARFRTEQPVRAAAAAGTEKVGAAAAFAIASAGPLPSSEALSAPMRIEPRDESAD